MIETVLSQLVVCTSATVTTVACGAFPAGLAASPRLQPSPLSATAAKKKLKLRFKGFGFFIRHLPVTGTVEKKSDHTLGPFAIQTAGGSGQVHPDLMADAP